LVIDELVRRTSDGSPDQREALMEVVLYDNDDEELQYIPIVS
jgi:hypothetical protein